MIERYAFYKFKDEFQGAAAIDEVVRAMSDCLGNLPMVAAFSLGRPADEASAAAWDLALRVRFGGAAELAAYQADATHAKLVDEVLAPRLIVRKAWNFAVEGP